MASPAVDYARSNQQRFLNELKDLLRIPSISTLEEHKSDVQKAADVRGQRAPANWHGERRTHRRPRAIR